MLLLQNEANLHPPARKCAKRTQFCPGPRPELTKRTQSQPGPQAQQPKNAKRTQFPPPQKCETNPIPVYQVSYHPLFQRNEPNPSHDGPVEDEKYETNPIPGAAISRNEPNLPPRPPRLCETNPISTSANPWKTQKCETNPICRVRICETNPIYPRPKANSQNMRNEPNLSPGGLVEDKKRETNPIYRPTATILSSTPSGQGGKWSLFFS